MSSGDGQVVDAPHRPSRQPFRYSLGDRRDYQQGRARTSPKFYRTFLNISFQRLSSRRIPSRQRHQSIPLSAPSHSQLPDGHNHPNSTSMDPQGTTATGQSRRPTLIADGSSAYRYFGNPRKSAATDLDLRNIFKLDQVTGAVDAVDSVPEGWEIWIWPMGWRRQKTPGRPVIHWVDHRYCRILNEMPFDDLPLSGEDDSAFSYLLR